MNMSYSEFVFKYACEMGLDPNQFTEKQHELWQEKWIKYMQLIYQAPNKSLQPTAKDAAGRVQSLEASWRNKCIDIS